MIEIRCLPPRRQVDDPLASEKTEIEKIADSKAIVVCPRCHEPGHIFLTCPKRVNTDKAPSDDVVRHEKMSMHDDISIKITNLSVDVTNHDLEALVYSVCKQYNIAHPNRVSIVYDRDREAAREPHNRDTRISRGIAYVNYSDEKQAKRFVEILDKHKYNSRVLEVEIATNRSDDRRSGGRGDRYNIDARATKIDDFQIGARGMRR